MKPPYLLDDHLPDQRLSDDENPPPVTYPTRREGLIKTMENARAEYKADPYDFEYTEIERLNGQVLQLQGRLDAIQAEWQMVHTTCPVPAFVSEWFAGLGLLIEGGE